MDWFTMYIDYCRKSDLPAKELEKYLSIFNETKPSMIRRLLSMHLKEQLEQLPAQVDTTLHDDLKELLKVMKPVSKALTTKIEKVKTKETKDDFLKKFRASQMIR